MYSRGQKFETKVDFCVRSCLFRSTASEIIRDCILLSGGRQCDARDLFQVINSQPFSSEVVFFCFFVIIFLPQNG